ncbi:hypothetical protein KW790_02700 [Candidatus Parcubacteria bacterium]|nr:hypothetical protein [Candidatus Parcubacteria bacterium]
MRTVKPARSLPPDAVLLLLDGKWPDGSGFEWNLVEEFRSLSPGTLQGFHDGEPVGTALRFEVERVY